jgi:PBP1b-binding outer membrane lipoprotein LpoB
MLTLVGAFMLTGCASMIAPQGPNLLADNAHYTTYSWDKFEKDRQAYENALLNADPNGIMLATYYRNKMLWSVINDIDYSYYTFRTDFFKSRATITTLSDMAKLGMSAAATVLGGSAVLSGAVTALEGLQLSVDKNLFEQKATESIFTTMDTLRQERMTQIQRKLLMPPPSYSFEEAYSDALSLFNAGCVPNALQRISVEAGQQQLKVKSENEEATMQRVLATLPEVTAESLTMKTNLNKIITDIISHNDREVMKKILSNRGISFELTASSEDLASKVGNELRNARTPEQIKKMVEQFKKIKIWKE